jgi:hypothetical protein
MSLDDENNADDLLDLNMPFCLLDTILRRTTNLTVEEGEIIQCERHPDDLEHRTILRNGQFDLYPMDGEP